MKLNKITNFSLEKAAIKPQEDNKHQDLNTKREWRYRCKTPAAKPRPLTTDPVSKPSPGWHAQQSEAQSRHAVTTWATYSSTTAA